MRVIKYSVHGLFLSFYLMIQVAPFLFSLLCHIHSCQKIRMNSHSFPLPHDKKLYANKKLSHIYHLPKPLAL